MLRAHKHIGFAVIGTIAIVSAACSVLSDFDSIDTAPGSTESTSDAEAADSGPAEDSGLLPPDTGADTGPDDGGIADATTARFCASIDAMTCEDFDDNPQDLNDIIDCKKYAVRALETSIASSPPHSVAITQSDAGTLTCHYTKSSQGGVRSILRAEFDIYIGDFAPNAEFVFAMLRIGSLNRVQLTHSATATRIQDLLDPEAGAIYIPSTSADWPTPLPSNKWANVTIEVNVRDVNAPVATVRLDGVTVIDNYALAKPWATGGAQAYIGLESSTSAPVSVRFDNIVIYSFP